jgi:hypothetical protein
MGTVDIDGIYTPDYIDLGDEYVYARTDWANTTIEEAKDEFARGMAEHDREVRAQTYEALAADPHHGWAIAGSLRDMVAVERGQMTQAEMDEKWGVER